MHLTVGTIFDNRFEILSPLGRGGMGEVYLALQKDLDRKVALKLLIDVCVNTDLVHRMEREALTLSSLTHTAIVSIYGFARCGDIPYLYMEFVEGQTLQSVLLDEQPLAVLAAIEIIDQLCEALAYVHRHGVVHRDLKAENIMLVQHNGRRRVKLIDWGLAKIIPEFGKELQKLTSTGQALGTVFCMSPEQCLAKSVDHRADIYSLGVILHQCVTGRVPFARSNPVAVMMCHLRESPPVLAEVAPDADIPGLQAVIHRAMAKEPADRYQTMEELQDDLKLVAIGEGSSIRSRQYRALPARTLLKASLSFRRNSKLIPLFAMGVILTIALCVGLCQQQSSPALLSQALQQWKLPGPDAHAKAVNLLVAALSRNTKDHLLTDIQNSIPNDLLDEAVFDCLEGAKPEAVDLLTEDMRRKRDRATFFEWSGRLGQHMKSDRAWMLLMASLVKLHDPEELSAGLTLFEQLPLSSFSDHEVGVVENALDDVQSMMACGAGLTSKECATRIVRSRTALANYFLDRGLKAKARKQSNLAFAIATGAHLDCDEMIPLSMALGGVDRWDFALDCAQACKTDVHNSYAVQMLALEHLNRHSDAMAVFANWKKCAFSDNEFAHFADMEGPLCEMSRRGYAGDCQEIRQVLTTLVERNQALCRDTTKDIVLLDYPLPGQWKYREFSTSDNKRAIGGLKSVMLWHPSGTTLVLKLYKVDWQQPSDENLSLLMGHLLLSSDWKHGQRLLSGKIMNYWTQRTKHGQVLDGMVHVSDNMDKQFYLRLVAKSASDDVSIQDSKPLEEILAAVKGFPQTTEDGRP